MSYKILTLHQGKLCIVQPIGENNFAYPPQYETREGAIERLQSVNNVLIHDINPKAYLDKKNYEYTIMEFFK